MGSPLQTPFPPAVGGLVSGQVPSKGSLINVSTRESRAFMFNPTEVKVSHGWDYAQHKPAGISIPFLAGGAGKERTVEFTLRLDGERARANIRRLQFGTSDDGGTGLDISTDLQWYESLTYAEEPQQGQLGATIPPALILTLGSLFTRAPSVLVNCSYTVLMWTPLMEPMRADVQLTLWANERKFTYNTDVYQSKAQVPDAISGVGQNPNSILDNLE